MNTTEVTPPSPAPNIDLFAPTFSEQINPNIEFSSREICIECGRRIDTIMQDRCGRPDCNDVAAKRFS